MAQIKGKDVGVGTLEILEALRHRETYRQAWHRHVSLETHYVLSGALSYEFGDAHPPVTSPGGTFLVIPPGVGHRAVNGEGTPSVRLVARWMPSGRATGPCPFTAREFRAFFADSVVRPFDVRRSPPRLARAVREVFRVAENNEPPAIKRLAAWSLLAETAAAVRGGEPSATVAKDVVDEICKYVHDHCGERLRMDDLVRKSGYSERRLFTLFRACAGLSPGNYLARCRIDRAKRLMSETPRPRLLDVALACGFSSASHFAAVFRKYAGETPRDYMHDNRDTFDIG